jgi:hypothetical protein
MASSYANAFPIAHAGAYSTPQAGPFFTPQAGAYATPQMATGGIPGFGGTQAIGSSAVYSPVISDSQALIDYMDAKYGQGLWLPSGFQSFQEN